MSNVFVTPITGGGGGGTASAITALNLDPGGRLRISDAYTLGDYQFKLDANPDQVETFTITAATAAYDGTKQGITLTATELNDKAIAQTYQWHPYFAGKPPLYELTSIGFQNETNIVKRFGCFHTTTSAPFAANQDGISIVSRDGDYFFEIHRNGTQTASVSRANWDDPLDGTGDSGFTIDWSGFNVFAINFLWLGGTGVTFMVKNGYDWVVAHTIPWAGEGNNSVMMLSPSQPIRYEITQTGELENTGSFTMVCAAAISEGTRQPSGMPRVSGTGAGAAIQCNAAGSEYAICGIRQKTGTGRRISAIINSITASAQANNDKFLIRVLLNPQINGVTVWSTNGNSQLEYGLGNAADPSTTTVSDPGMILYEAPGTDDSTTAIQPEFLRRIGSSIEGLNDEIWLTVIPRTANQDIYGSINFYEI